MEGRDEIKEALVSYAERLRQVRVLSAPSVEEVKDADDYSRLLLHNFRRIGELAGENAEVLDKILMPMLQGTDPIDEETAEELDALNQLLSDTHHDDMVDTCLAEMINHRLTLRPKELPEDENESDPDKRVSTLDRNIDMAYEHMARSFRCGDVEEMNKAIRKGDADYQELLGFLEKDKFASLSPEAKKTVITDAGYGACLYETTAPAEMMRRLKEFRKLIRDPFYQEQLPNFDWSEREFLACEYMAEISYGDDLTEEIYRESFKAGLECEKMLTQGKAGDVGSQLGEEHVRSVVLIAAARIMDPSLEGRLTEVIELYERRDINDYSRSGTNANLGTAVIIFQIINILRENRGGTVPEKLLTLQRRIPDEMMRYYSLSRKAGMSLSFGVHLNNFLSYFREIPGGIRCSELCMRVLVAIHPPTYVHSNMVAQLSLCIARHLISERPERFIGFPGCNSLEEVKEARDRILTYVYNSALYHDVGKLTIIDTISMYGRKLLDAEFLVLRTHPENGANMAETYDSLKDYADVIRGHHLWYDGSAGYPKNFKTADSPYKPVIDVVMVADCMDAATDRVGRSYSRGKTLEEFVREVEEGAGTRYAPYVAEILRKPETYADIEYLLAEGRKQIYKDTFAILKDMFRRGEMR